MPNREVLGLRRIGRCVVTFRSGPTASSTLSILLEQGLPVPRKPIEEIPTLPSDLTVLSDEDLMILYTHLTAWSDYVSTQVSIAQIDEREISNELDRAENRMMILSSANGDRVTYARAQVAADPTIVGIKKRVDEAYAYRKLVESLAANVERDAALVSRELTRRTSSRSRTSPSRWSA